MSRPICNERVKSPCLKCEDRELGCHDKCESYKEFRAKLQDMKDRQSAANNYEHKEYKLREWPKSRRGGKVWKDHKK